MERFIRRIVFSLLLATGILAYTSAWNDTAIVDEDPHIGAGISYLAAHDMRLNPEHPPLIKDIAALPLLLIPGLNVPFEHHSWVNDINGQWDFGRAFLFESGNDADLILRLARIAPIIVMLMLGWFIFQWARERGGVATGFFALFFYIFSPVILAHGRFVTTDVSSAAGIFLATYTFVRFLQRPSSSRLAMAGLVFGLAQLTKFSVFLLVPFFGVLAALWCAVEIILRRTKTPSALIRFFGGTFLIGLIGLAVIYGVYAFHVWHYPQERQIGDIEFVLASFPSRFIADAVVGMARIDVLRPFAQYLFGLAMVFQRATGGNTTYFLGEVSASGWAFYFPVVYFIKTPLAFHIATLLALLMGLRIFSSGVRNARRARETFWEIVHRGVAALRSFFPEVAMILFVTLYWYTSLSSNLNIGVRHLIPTFPFLFILVARGMHFFLRAMPFAIKNSASKNILLALRSTVSTSARFAIAVVLFVWLAIVGILSWPFYLASFNEVAALRPDGSAGWAVDSNLDWGQDLKRLSRYVEERDVDRIAVDYFGWTPPGYYIRTAQVIPWSQEKGQPSGWFALSATYKQQACARAVPGFSANTTGYCFLNDYEPEAVIGGSIYVYHLP